MIFDRKSLRRMLDLRLVLWGTAGLAIGVALALDDRPGWAAVFLLATVFTTPLVAVPAVAALLLVLGAAIHGPGLSFGDWLRAYWLPAAGWLGVAALVIGVLVWSAAAEVALTEAAKAQRARRTRAPPAEQAGAAREPAEAGEHRDPR